MNMQSRTHSVKERIEHELGIRERKIGVIGGEDAVIVQIEGRALAQTQRQQIEDLVRTINPDCTVTINERISAF